MWFGLACLMMCLGEAGNVHVQFREDVVQWLHFATGAGGVQCRLATGTADFTENFRQTVIEVGLQRVVADKSHSAIGKKVQVFEEQILVQSSERSRGMGKASFAFGVDQNQRRTRGLVGMCYQATRINFFCCPIVLEEDSPSDRVLHN